MTDERRILWIDQLRGLAMMAILWFHTEMYYAGCDVTPYGLYVCNALATFYFISGYLFTGRAPFSPAAKLKSIGRGIVLPYFFFTLLLAVPKALATGQPITDVIMKILLGNGSWFVASLAVAEALMTAALAVEKRWVVHTMVWTGLIAALLLTDSEVSMHYNFWNFHNALVGLWFLYAGWLYRGVAHRIPLIHRLFNIPILLLILIVLKIVEHVQQYNMLMEPVYISNYPVFLADCLASVLLGIAVATRLPKLRFLEWTGRHSLVYYFFCGAVPTVVSLALGKLGFGYDEQRWRLVPAFLLVYALTTAVAWAAYRWLPFLRRRGRVAALVVTVIASHAAARANIDASTLLQLGLPVVEVTTVGAEEPTCDYIFAPEGENGISIANATKVPGRVVVRSADATLFDSGDYEKGASGMTIKIRGNTSAYYSDKKPYKIKLEKKADMLCRGDKRFNDKEWVLLRDGDDALNTLMGFTVSRLVDMAWTPAYQFVNLTVNGDYRGVYMLTEQVKRNADCRLNVDKQTGYVVECDSYWWKEQVYFKTGMGKYYTFKYPDPDDLTPSQLSYISQELELAETAISSGTYPERIDVASFAA